MSRKTPRKGRRDQLRSLGKASPADTATPAQVQRAVDKYLGVQQQEVLSLMQEQYSGPLPHPSHLEQYEAILPGLADRIVKMTEGQVAHRQDMEAQLVKSSLKHASRGIWCAFIIAMSAVIGGIYLVLRGHSLEGASATIAALAALAGVFMYDKRQRRRNPVGAIGQHPEADRPPKLPTQEAGEPVQE